MTERHVSKKIDFDLLTLKFGKMPKYINWHISVSLQDIKMRFELSLTVSRRTHRAPTVALIKIWDM